MINKLRTFALAILVATVTATATKARAAATTNTQVLDNISIQLKLTCQGALGHNNISLAPVTQTLTTSELINQLVPFDGVAFSPSQKLVFSTIYSNFQVGIPGTITTNFTATLTNALHVWYYDGGPGSLSSLDIVNHSTTNSYAISNGTIWLTFNGATHYPIGDNNVGSITTNAIFTGNSSGSTLSTTNTFDANPIPAPGNSILDTGGELGYWVTIVPTITTNSTNITITQYSPQLNTLFTNLGRAICVYTPRSSTVATASLVDVDNWVQLAPGPDVNLSDFSVYKETGKNLQGEDEEGNGDVLGTNITGQTITSFEQLAMFTAWPTNIAPTLGSGQTNLIFGDWAFTNMSSTPATPWNYYMGDTPLSGIATTSAKFINLVANGNSKDKLMVQTIASSTATVTGAGYMGGVLSTNSIQTNTFNGVISTNNSYGNSVLSDNIGFNNLVGTTLISRLDGNTIYLQNVTNVLASGTVSIDYLTAISGADQIPVSQPGAVAPQ
ncbi:MAG: hypothetical protein ABSA83_18155 [Verrucomicrobiota bacterium]|jgi:hypothetical protein